MSKLKHSPLAVLFLLTAGVIAAAPQPAIAQLESAPDVSGAPAAPSADTTPSAPTADVAAPPPDAAPSGDATTSSAAAPTNAGIAVQASDTPISTDPLYADGPYATIQLRLDHSDGPLDFGYGGGLGAGLRRGPVAIEVNAAATHSHSSNLFGGTIDGLVFPFEKLPGLFATVGIGVTYADDYPHVGKDTFNITTFDGGAGYLLPLHFGSYEAGLRAQVVYQYGKRQKRSEDERPPVIDLPVQSNFHEIIASIGLQFPFGSKIAPLSPRDRPVAVVPLVAEVPPPPSPPKPQCLKPAPGEKITLDGCGTGDVIVLNGVNFEFNQATLTVNAKTILDQVDAELIAHPDIKVELAGHTDDKGSAPYNQKLSQKRAEAVRDYFIAHNIDGERMTAVGYGKTQPIATNDTDEGRAQNRRTELRITASNGEVAQPVSVPTGTADAPAPSEGVAPPASP